MKKKSDLRVLQYSYLKKMLMKLKIALFIVLVSVTNIFATHSYSQLAKVSLDMENKTLEQVMDEIERQSEFYFIFNQKQIDVDRIVTVQRADTYIDEVLNDIFSDTDVYYAVLDKKILLAKEPLEEEKNAFDMAAEALQNVISGTVRDGETGQVMPGVNIQVKGTTIGAITDINGQYTLPSITDRNVTLVFSFIGYSTQEVPADGRMVVDVNLVAEVTGLEEVVVIGYGVQKKSNITGAITSVGSEDLINRSTSNVSATLQGKAAGVQVLNTSGAPGASSALRIRGYSSNGISEPLYIVDGLKVPDINYLDPGNIQNIEILKDAASAAIYGAEAGNGVVLITTKTGKQGEGKIFYNAQYSILNQNKKVDLLNAEEFINYYTERDPTFITILDNFYYNDPSASVNGKLADTDWQDELYTTGYRMHHTLGFQGGNERGSFYISMDFLDEDGIVVGQKDLYNRFSGQFNGSYRIKEWLTVGITNSLIKSKTRRVGESDVANSIRTVISGIYVADPLTPVEYIDGLTPLNLQQAVDDGFQPLINETTKNYYGISQFQTSNPIAMLNSGNEYADGFSINGTVYANIEPLKDLVYTSRLGYRFNNSSNYSFFPAYWTPYNVSENETLSMSQSNGSYYQWENFASYNLSLKKSTFMLTAGMSFINNIRDNISASTDELLNLQENFRYLNYSTVTANDNITGNRIRNSQIAYFGRFGWNYDQRYNLQFNFRADAYDASKLHLDHAWGYFPSVSGGWTITNEGFMQNFIPNVLSFLKLRASYGINGSISNLGGYQYSSSLMTGNPYFLNPEGKLYVGTYPSTYLANPKLRWEESTQLDVGLDIRLFGDKLSLTADYYNKNTNGLLILSKASLITGTNNVFQNVGIINNQGYEFDLEWKDLIADKVQYTIKVNLATVKNEVVEYEGKGVRIDGAEVPHSHVPVTFFEEGYPVWYFRTYVYKGVNEANGGPIIEDINSDGTINDADKTMVGNPIPDFTFGTTISLAYKNFDLLAYGTGAIGGDIFYAVVKGTTGILANKPHFMYDNRWTPENTTAKNPSAYYQTNDLFYMTSDAMVFDGSFFKINQIQVGYNVPTSMLNKILVSSLRAYVSLENYFTFTSYPGLDPETRAGTSSSMGIDLAGYPILKSLMFGINLTF